MAAISKNRILCEQLFQICSPQSHIKGTIKESFGRKSTRDLRIIFSEDSNCVNIIDNVNITANVTCSHGVHDACLVHDEDLYLWTLSSMGAITCTALPELCGPKHLNGRGGDAEDQRLFEDLLKESTEIPKSIAQSAILIEKRNTEHIFVIDNCLVTVGVRESVCFLDLYYIQKLGPSDVSLLAYKSYELPFVDCRNAEYHYGFRMFCLYSSSTEPNIEPSFNQFCSFPSKHLYNGIFQVESNLINSPIILLALPSGLVYGMATKCGDLSLRPKLICDLQQPVVGIHCFPSHNSKENQSLNDQLMFVGLHGKVLIVHAPDAEFGLSGDCPNLVFKECLVKGPVVCSSLTRESLVHCTNQTICLTSVEQLLSSEKHQYIPSEILNFKGSISISPVRCGQGRANKDKLIWLSLNRRGWLYKHTLEISTDEKGNRALGSNSSSRSLKDLLNDVTRLTDQVNYSKEQISVVDGHLAQLSLAGYVAAAPATYEAVDTSSIPLLLEAKLILHRLGTSMKAFIRVRLKNQSPIKLSQNWQLVLTLCTLSSMEKSGMRWVVCSSKCVDVSELSPDDFQDTLIELTESQLSAMPLRVQPSLCFILGDPLVSQVLGQELSIAIPLPDYTVDIVDTLQLRPAKAQVQSSKSCHKTIVEKIAEQKCSSGLYSTSGATSMDRSSRTESLGFVFDKKEIKKCLRGVGRKDIPAALLELLLQDSSISCCGEELIVRAQTYSHPVTFTVGESKSEEIELKIESPHLESLIQTAIAISLRIQDVEREASLLRDEMSEAKNISKDLALKIVDMYMRLRSNDCG